MFKKIKPILLLVLTIIHNASSLECASYTSKKIKTIPQEYINDNYCDCPYTGEDEPNTSACSGSINWSSSSDDDKDYFQCKGQNLLLSKSKVNDGICDCCAGNDEYPGVCPDICEEVLAEERRMQREMKEAFDIGYKLNLESGIKYKEFVEQTKKEMEDIQLKINDIDVDVKERTKDYKEEIQQWRVGRRRILEEAVISEEYSWILALTPQEAKALILGLCQLSGEWWYTLPKVTKVDSEDKTCIPLHLAAFDLGYMFNINDDSVEFTTWKPSDEDGDKLNLPQLLLELELGYTSGNKKPVTSNLPDHEKHDYLDDEEMYDSGDDYYEHDDDIIHHKQQTSDPIDGVEETNVEPVQLIIPRTEFEMEGKKIVNMIQAIFDTPSEDEDNDTNEEAELHDERMLHEEDQDSMPPPPIEEKQTKPKINVPDNIDTIQLQKVQKDIKTLLKYISIGKNYLKSSSRMIDSLFDDSGSSLSNEYFQNDNYLFPCLLLSTLYHSRLSSIDLYSIVYHSVPEIYQQQVSNICDAVPYIERNLKSGNDDVFSVTIPSSKILNGSKRYCEERKNIMISACTEQQSIVVEAVIIPYNTNGCISNHFPTAYFKEEEGHENILPSFQSVNSKVSTSKQTDIDTLHQEMTSLQNEIEEKEKNLNSDKFGSNGELYAFKDEECFEKKANQYVYEVCMLSDSYQKEGSSKTSLGKFQSFKVEHNIIDSKTKTTMTAYFDKGQRCWQGQNRKSKVDIICGSALGELISTEEPEVCSYEFILKSFIACTDDYGRENGLIVGECANKEECSS